MSRESVPAGAAPGVARRLPVHVLWAAILTLLAPALRADEPGAAAPSPDPSLLLGTYDVGPDTVVDADTLRLAGGSLVRVLGVDAEEVFKAAADRGAAAADFAAYAKEKRGDSKTPVKFGTPAGEAAKAYVSSLLSDVKRFRLERDEAKGRDVDMYGRLLAHVVLEKPGGDVLLAETLVRHGHSPYFVKYGRSLRFDAALRNAEAQAREARLGIWAEGGPPHYPDYPDRLAWWERRAVQVDAWRKVPAAEDRIALGVPAESDRLAGLAGKPVTVFGLVEHMRTAGTPKILGLGDVKGRDLPVVFFLPVPWASLDLEALATLYVTVKGTVTLYRGKAQIVVEQAEQVSTKVPE